MANNESIRNKLIKLSIGYDPNDIYITLENLMNEQARNNKRSIYVMIVDDDLKKQEILDSWINLNNNKYVGIKRAESLERTFTYVVNTNQSDNILVFKNIDYDILDRVLDKFSPIETNMYHLVRVTTVPFDCMPCYKSYYLAKMLYNIRDVFGLNKCKTKIGYYIKMKW